MEDLEKNLDILAEKLLDRNYPDSLIKEKFEKAKKLSRKDILKNRKKKIADDKVRGIFTHNEANPPLQKWIRLSKKSLIKNDKAKALGKRIQIGWRQNNGFF